MFQQYSYWVGLAYSTQYDLWKRYIRMDKITAGCRKIITYEKNDMVTAWNTCIDMGLVKNNKKVLLSSQKTYHLRNFKKN